MRHKRAGRIARVIRLVRPTKRWSTRAKTTAEGLQPMRPERTTAPRGLP